MFSGTGLGKLTRFGRPLIESVIAHDVPGSAAAMSYQFSFALFPFLIFLAALMGFVGDVVGHENLFVHAMDLAAVLVPRSVEGVVADWIHTVVYTRSPSLLTIGAGASLLGASAGVGTLARGMNRAYGVANDRPFWLAYVVGLVGVISLAAVMFAGVVLYTVGEWLGEQATRSIGLDEGFLTSWRLARGPGVSGGLFLTLVGLYAVLPNLDVGLRGALPGALFATAAWMVVTKGFSIYVANLGRFDQTYGSLSAAIVLMVWIYVVSVLLLVGGEINAVISGPKIKVDDARDNSH